MARDALAHIFTGDGCALDVLFLKEKNPNDAAEEDRRIRPENPPVRALAPIKNAALPTDTIIARTASARLDSSRAFESAAASRHQSPRRQLLSLGWQARSPRIWPFRLRHTISKEA